MKVTKEYLKQLIIEQMKEQQDITAAAEDAFDKAVSQAGGGDLDKPQAQTMDMKPQELKKKILDMATNVAGIMKNELDIVNFALTILDTAKNKNLNSGILRQKLELVRDEMARIES